MLRDVSAKLEEATRKALSGEFGADWENKPDLAATLAALPDVLERYAPDTDAIFAENLDTVGERLLFAVVRQTYAVALANDAAASATRGRMVDRIAIVKTGWSDWYQGGRSLDDTGI